MNNPTLSSVVDKFLQYRAVVKNNSNNTLTAYRAYLCRFIECVGDKNMDKINVEDVYQYRITLSKWVKDNGEILSLKTQNENLVAVRQLLKFCAHNDIKALAADRIELPRFREKVVEFLNRFEVGLMFEAAKGDSVVDLRNTAILETLFSTGLRVSELVSLDRNKIDLFTKEFTVIGKGGKPRLVFLSDRAALAIVNYLSKREDDLNPVFINHSSNAAARSLSGRITKHSVTTLVRQIAKKAGILKPVTSHIFRHSFATDLLNNGADIRYVQELLGHASIKTTQIYTHVTNWKLREVHQKYHNKIKNEGGIYQNFGEFDQNLSQSKSQVL